MQAYTYISKGRFELVEKPKPVLLHERDAIVKVTLASICSSDLHIKHGSVPRAVPGITVVDMNHEDTNKSFVIQVTDSELLELTGGIVQGMSGSPVIQNGKFVGAVTHVFIQDSTGGYGIFAENMLENI